VFICKEKIVCLSKTMILCVYLRKYILYLSAKKDLFVYLRRGYVYFCEEDIV
jgi:hypothetical protein